MWKYTHTHTHTCIITVFKSLRDWEVVSSACYPPSAWLNFLSNNNIIIIFNIYYLLEHRIQHLLAAQRRFTTRLSWLKTPQRHLKDTPWNTQMEMASGNWINEFWAEMWRCYILHNIWGWLGGCSIAWGHIKANLSLSRWLAQEMLDANGRVIWSGNYHSN